MSEIRFSRPSAGMLLVYLYGDWALANKLPDTTEMQKQLESAKVVRVYFDTQGLTGWDSGLLIFLTKAIDFCPQKNIRIEKESLPQGVQKSSTPICVQEEKKVSFPRTHSASLQ